MLRGERGAVPPSDVRVALHVGLRRVARLSLLYLTETALSQNAIWQERARQGTLDYFRTDSAPSVKRSRELGTRDPETTFPTMQWEF